MALIRNEQTKLTASWLNAISAASIAVGGFAQLAPAPGGTSGTPFTIVTALGLGWMSFGLVLHWVARRVLRRLEE